MHHLELEPQVRPSPADLFEDRLPLVRVCGDLCVLEQGPVAAADLQVGIAVGVVADEQLVVLQLELAEGGRPLPSASHKLQKSASRESTELAATLCDSRLESLM